MKKLGLFSLVRFYSSDEYYQIQWTVDPETKVESDYMVKRVRQPNGEFATAWKTRLYIQYLDQTFGISPNGKKIFAKGWDLNVLDTATGEVIFDMPMVDVVPNALDPNEGLGGVSRVGITDDGLEIYRRYDSGESSRCRYWDHACYSALEQAGLLRDVIDIVPFDGMTLDSKPTERRVIRPRPPSPCDGAGDFAIRREPDGELSVERLPPFGVPDDLSEARSEPESGPAVPDVSDSLSVRSRSAGCCGTKHTRHRLWVARNQVSALGSVLGIKQMWENYTSRHWPGANPSNVHDPTR